LDAKPEVDPFAKFTGDITMSHLRFLRTKFLLVVILLVSALSMTSVIVASTDPTDLPFDEDEVQQTYFIYLPAISNQVEAATSSATLVQPPAVQQLGGLAGVLAAGFAIGIALLFWREPEEEAEKREGIEEIEGLGD
jgi:hypothetical protein